MLQLDVLFGNLGEMVEFQVEFLRTLEDGIRLVPDLDRLERVEQFKVLEFMRHSLFYPLIILHDYFPKILLWTTDCYFDTSLYMAFAFIAVVHSVYPDFFWSASAAQTMNFTVFAFSLTPGVLLTIFLCSLFDSK